ncbi:peroxiredoxin [Sulfolobus sp. A20]|uniref:OsmC family protein n=2 Tax=Sulfolobaceae TaxID=118883 RepID=UPI000845D7B3|nr:OsmC family protein [Sulfolobus sp. A20]TRM77161.1 OsmC family peroxiredoxin [Sulfolobus sp. A20-N-F8]TRM79220.1 OsmC family peroxiredoxin [Sulfolobus sp. B5]TRM80674.1 OsmC family peroxiredoxin [Sulfolobus sp. D5]TRM81366.1 OsmC family peroxiredoxin [Sulfolobus sp. A20-N-F6]TRM85416.1 OsmC family peroxiredoxin [Sulfolobus sp. F3]TRM85892.1 OsmC family peroxiredoxin [Sulfolobus sp. E3]TRM88918.1 OsmC family peroxiredoxin [Sulfolobus sp. C3]TRM98922.1 OsmC family peroxiredoxin [Sulfolobus
MKIITFVAEGKLDGDKVTITLGNNDYTIGLIGSDYPTPEEFCLASALSCLILTIYYIGRERGIEIESIDGFIEGKLDPRGFQGDNNVPPGLLEVNYEISITSSDTRINELIKEAEKRCPMRDTLTRSVKVNIKWRIKS